MNCQLLKLSLQQRLHRAIAATAISILVVQFCSRIMASDVQTPIEPKVNLPELTVAGIVQSKDPGTLPEIFSRQMSDPVARDQLRAKEQASAKPVAGATVKITFYDIPDIVDHFRPPPKKLSETSVMSDAAGQYTYTRPAGKIRGNQLGVEVTATHPNFIARRRGQSAPSGLIPIVLNPLPAPVPFGPPQPTTQLDIDLLPATAVTGELQSPDGKPVAGATVMAYARPSEWQTSSCVDETKSDENGKFHLQMVEEGNGVVWINPESDYVPVREEIKGKRGDLGAFKLETGIIVKGRVLEADGKPCPDMEVLARMQSEFPNPDSIDFPSSVQRRTQTNAAGDFVFAPLPPGQFGVGVITPRPQFPLPLSASRFRPQAVSLVDGRNPDPIEIRSSYNPDTKALITGHVTISKAHMDEAIQILRLLRVTWSRLTPNVANNPFDRGPNDGDRPEDMMLRFAPAIRGTVNGVQFMARAEIDEDGNFTAQVPRGLERVTVYLASTRSVMLASAPTSSSPIESRGDMISFLLTPQWLITPSKTSNKGNTISLPSIGDGLTGVEIEYPEIEKPAGFKVRGTVQDEDTGKPIPGTTVSVSMRQAGRAEFGADSAVDSTPVPLGDSLPDANGTYSVIIPFKRLLANLSPAVGRMGRLIFELNAKHPTFASPRAQSDNLELNFTQLPTLTARRRFTTGRADDDVQLLPIFMRPGKEVTGILQAPEGKPAAGVKVVASTWTPVGIRLQAASRDQFGPRIRPELADKQWYGWEEATTDADGKFRFLLPAEGNATLAVWPAKDFVLLDKKIKDKRGDLGVIELQRGPTIKGRVIDADGKPLVGAYLNAELTNPEEPPLDSQNERSIDYLQRAATTDEHGNFAFAPLAPGEYRIEPRESVSDLATQSLQDPQPDKHPLPDLLIPQKVTLVVGQEPEMLEFHMPASLTIEGQIKFGRDRRTIPNRNPYASYKPIITGKVNDLDYTANVLIDEEGHFTAKVPRGMSEVKVKLADRSGPTYRLGKDKPPVDLSTIDIGTMNENVRDFVIEYP